MLERSLSPKSASTHTSFDEPGALRLSAATPSIPLDLLTDVVEDVDEKIVAEDDVDSATTYFRNAGRGFNVF